MKKKALMVVGRNVGQFLTDDMMNELHDMLELTVRNGESLDEQDYAQALADVEAEIVITGWRSPLLTQFVVSQNPQLKYMCNLTGSVRPMVSREVVAKGLLVSNWGNLIGPTVAEAALMGMLSCLRRSVRVAFLMHHEKDGGEMALKMLRAFSHKRLGYMVLEISHKFWCACWILLNVIFRPMIRMPVTRCSNGWVFGV